MADIYDKYDGELPNKIIEDIKKLSKENKLTIVQIKKVLEESK